MQESEDTMPTEPKVNYLAKLLTLLVKRNGNTIAIPVQDLMVDDTGHGFQVHFNQDTRELILTYVPPGSTIYRVEAQVSWLSNQLIPQSLPQPPRPLTREELISKVWEESPPLQPLQPEVEPPKRPKVVHLTTEGMAEAEDQRRKAQALREIENFQPSNRTPPVRPPSRQAMVFSKP